MADGAKLKLVNFQKSYDEALVSKIAVIDNFFIFSKAIETKFFGYLYAKLSSCVRSILHQPPPGHNIEGE